MDLTISFKNFPHTEAVDERIRQKSEKICKLLGDEKNIKWTCYSKDKQYYVEVKVTGPQLEYHAKAHHENMYKSFDLVTAKLEKQLSKKKGKWKNKMHKHEHNKQDQQGILDPEQAWTDYVPEEEADIAS
jgi:putative sigma-54 modulation protein